ncbi:hypothetical protein [Helicobacter sp. T3_23-1056]
MQYNITNNKMQKLQTREQDKKAQEVLNNAANANNVSSDISNAQTTKDKQDNMQKENQMNQNIPQEKNLTSKKSDKKAFCLYVSESRIKELDEFLDEFGKKGESRNSFVEEAIEYYLQQRKIQLRQELEEKLKRI